MVAFPCRTGLLALALACSADESDSAGSLDGDGDGFIAREDCDDSNPDIHPDAVELCDGQDNDCDGEVDMEDPGIVDYSTWFVDVDGDGYGSGDPILSCEAVEGHSTEDGDCDESDDQVFPGATETCGDGVDSNCDGEDPECEEE